MIRSFWQESSLVERIRWLRYGLPPILVMIVVAYQLGVAQRLAVNYGHTIHYGVEIGFYSLVGPIVTWLTLVWVERSLTEKERLERQVQAQTRQLASLTAASADAILSLDDQERITSWNRGAEGIFGYAAADMIGQPLIRLLPDAETITPRWRPPGVGYNLEAIACTQDGRSLTVELTSTRLNDPEHGKPASLIIMRDVTARHELAAIREEERARIARDLHDGVAQTLYFLALKADMARQQIAHDPHKVTTDLTEIGQKMRQVIRELRRTIFALRPLDWADGDFWQALQRFVDGFAEQAGWQAKVSLAQDAPALPPRLQPTLFRLVQESLNNVAKHAAASRVWIEVSYARQNSQLTLTVRDDGQGFAQGAEEASQGLGLAQMKSRVAAVGGDLELSSRPGSGTLMTARLPLPGDVYE